MSDDEGANNNELLVAACRQDNLEMLETVLSSDASTFDINHQDGLGFSALHHAARNGSSQCLEILLYFDGINVNITDRMERNTPLHEAAAFRDADTAMEMVSILIEGGASTNVLNKRGQTPVDIAYGDTHRDVKEYLERAGVSAHFDAGDVPAEDSDNSDDVASDDE